MSQNSTKRVKDLGLNDEVYLAGSLATVEDINTLKEQQQNLVKEISHSEYVNLTDEQLQQTIWVVKDPDVFMDGHYIHDLADGLTAQDAATVGQVDSIKRTLRLALESASSFEEFKTTVLQSL